MWPLKIALEALGGLAGKLGGALSLAGIAAAVLVAVFFWGVTVGEGTARVAQIRAELEAERNKTRRLSEIRDSQDRRIANLNHALRTIDDEPPLTGDGADCHIGARLLCQLRAEYDPNQRCDPPLPSRNQ